MSQANTGDWVAIELGNEWMSLFYTYAGERLKGFTNATENALDLREGMIIEAQFPDGSVQSLPLCRKTTSVSYGDMGRTYGAAQHRFGFEVTVCGATAWIPFEQVKVRLGSLARHKELGRP